MMTEYKTEHATGHATGLATEQTTADRMRVLLGESLQLWQAAATLLPRASTVADPDEIARVQAEDGLLLSIRRADTDQRPVRWWICWHAQTSVCSSEVIRRKPCPSVVGVLRTLRETLTAPAPAAGRGLRIARGPQAE